MSKTRVVENDEHEVLDQLLKDKQNVIPMTWDVHSQFNVMRTLWSKSNSTYGVLNKLAYEEARILRDKP